MKLLFCVIAFFLVAQVDYAQNNFTLSGTVKDLKTGETMIGAAVFVNELAGVGTVTNAYGFYSISLAKGKYTFSFRYASYGQKDTVIDLTRNVKLNMELGEKSIDLKEVE